MEVNRGKEELSVDEKIELYEKGVREIPTFASLKTISRFSSCLADDFPREAKVQFDNKIVDYKINSDEKLELIHYTNVQSFCNIINSQTIRLYNCFNLNDSREIEIGLNRIGFVYNEELLEELKRTHFVFSTSKFNGKEDFNMWRLYGDNGDGVAMVFEIDKEFEKWKGLHLSKISYSNEDKVTEDVNRYIEFHNQFKDKYGLFVDVPGLIPLLGAFQKNQIWSIEKEFRIIAVCKFNDYDFKVKEGEITVNDYLKDSLNHQVNYKGKMVSYLELPIAEKYIDSLSEHERYKRNSSNLKEYYPRIRLKKIILGYNNRMPPRFESLINFCEDIVPSKIGERVEYKFSEILD